MEERTKNEFVPMIRALWIEQKNRELLYLEALKKDNMGSCRRILSQGHVSALLFQKEIKWIYDYFKGDFERNPGSIKNANANMSNV